MPDDVKSIGETKVSRQVVWGAGTDKIIFGVVKFNKIPTFEVRWYSYYAWRDTVLLEMWWSYALHEGVEKIANGADLHIGDWADPCIEGVAAHILAVSSL